MNREELAFVNQQLAGMLNCGIPLEGGLRQLCENMRRGVLRRELEALEADLSKGVPLKKALEPRQLPELYKQMLLIGAAGNNLPAVLNLVANYYLQTHTLALRLRGLMVYPAIVMGFTLLLVGAVAGILQPLLVQVCRDLLEGMDLPPVITMVWVLPAILAAFIIFILVIIAIPAARRRLFWALPGFRDIGLARVGAAMHVLLKGGVSLPDALGLSSNMERSGPMADELRTWQVRLSQGEVRLDDPVTGFKTLPPLFLWAVRSSGDNLAKGFERAAEIYGRRARHQSEMVLFAAMPVAILFIAVFMVIELAPLFRGLIQLMESIGL